MSRVCPDAPGPCRPGQRARVASPVRAARRPRARRLQPQPAAAFNRLARQLQPHPAVASNRLPAAAAPCDRLSPLVTVTAGRLLPHPSTAERTIRIGETSTGDRLLTRGSGVLHVPSDHVGNGHSSREEAQLVRALCAELMGSELLTSGREARPLGWEDILVVAPYNVQARLLTQPLGRVAAVCAAACTALCTAVCAAAWPPMCSCASCSAL